ncbi:unnamed protein product [Fusarium graminearum]|uniref:Chromosome 2, complete genome n=1 Tax=Gibberella zeae (strain ATCC MYA-4620 / CBS 123657 / FGSC 9075 / NRRL 31084 / PH-1) TaxID=229533 RepID=I1RVH2_GIBZE|nr:hypothetical protein FGSG_08248 [Fusarium graminearum PH-1]ESU15129.1 hypothetical protein FGSG_08248 [Fusarium graminearum PH-1]CEF76538.1 unnamed protein product [Fusarium graminearum]CZS79831.1 unnamed protein product [Fusarium graminearum]|eukprot:XP_011320554.1 hypothetical protein FGSG_08248 [Fusarium graminearum PH-1]
MATGLEAVGAASAILSFISFAGKIVSISYKIYDGMPTDEDELEDYAGRMLDACEHIRSRSQHLHQSTPLAASISDIAQKCFQLSWELQKETQNITKRYQKGKFRRAVSMALRANAHKAKIKQLDQSLERYKKIMETELLSKICDTGTAIETQQSQTFPKLERDVQDLIFKIASTQTNMEILVTEEAKKTREVLSINLTTHIKDSETRAITDNQRQRLLKSLKPADIRKRYHEVLSPSDASFERVFASYERVCLKDPEHKDWKTIRRNLPDEPCPTMRYGNVDEIDCTWHSFTLWLQSDNPLFWIQGKPGSGKSTLMKFIIENKNTERLLKSHIANTRVLSYFLWKIGNESQNSIKGLICCLLHDLLVSSTEMLDQALKQFPSLESRDFFDEWSSEEAEKVLFFLLRSPACSTCIFIDGLDEISDKDGFEPLTKLIQSICNIPLVKVCVSSRLETGLIQKLEALGAGKLCLHDLTNPEMAVYVQKELARFSAGVISSSFVDKIIIELLVKAQGVFLWLFLAKNSLITGIENGDDEETLMRRLEELPSELEALYESMWSRLNAKNKVYRQTAAMYFHFLLAKGWNFKVIYPDVEVPFTVCERPRGIPTLAQLSMMVKVEEGRMFPPGVNNTSLYDLKVLCDATERDLSTRCAGMIQVSKAPIYNEIDPVIRLVEFVHRTAHDFLVDTKPGQDILSYYSGMKMTTDFQLKLFKSELSVYHTIGAATFPEHAIHQCVELQRQGVNYEMMDQLVRVMQSLWDQGLAHELTNMEDDPTIALRDICHEWNVAATRRPSILMIQRLIALDASPHAVGASSPPLRKSGGFYAVFTQETSAFELLLRGTLSRLIDGRRDAVLEILEVIDSLAPSCPDWGRRIMVFCQDAMYWKLLLHDWEFYWPTCGGATFEVNMQYLLRRLLVAVSCEGIPTQNYRLHEIANSAVESYSRVRNIVPRQRDDEGYPFCCRVVNQEPFKDLCDNMFGPQDKGHLNVDDLRNEEFYRNPKYDFLLGSYERVMLDDEVDQLASEDLGFHRITNERIADMSRKMKRY